MANLGIKILNVNLRIASLLACLFLLFTMTSCASKHAQRNGDNLDSWSNHRLQTIRVDYDLLRDLSYLDFSQVTFKSSSLSQSVLTKLTEIVDQELSDTNFKLRYGQQVSSKKSLYSLKVDLIDYRERIGGQFGVDKAALVSFVVSVENMAGEIIWQASYRHEQQGFSENLYQGRDVGIFKSASELFSEGIKQFFAQLERDRMKAFARVS